MGVHNFIFLWRSPRRGSENAAVITPFAFSENFHKKHLTLYFYYDTLEKVRGGKLSLRENAQDMKMLRVIHNT